MAVRPYRKVLVPVDGSRTAQAAVRHAVRLTGGGGRLRLVYVMDERLAVPVAGSATINSPAIYASLREAGDVILGEARRAAGREVAVESETLSGGARGAAGAIVREAKRWGADAIVMGTHGRTGVRRLLIGSVAEGVLRKAERPLLLVPRSTQRRAASAS